MKKLTSQIRKIFFLLIGISLAFLSAAFSSGATPNEITPSSTPPPTPTPNLDLDIGSTDGILVWAFLIALIIIVPLLWNWSLWLKRKN